jgi:hypothetical protein
MDKSEVSIAFEILLEELETLVDSLNADSLRGVWEASEKAQAVLSVQG